MGHYLVYIPLILEPASGLAPWRASVIRGNDALPSVAALKTSQVVQVTATVFDAFVDLTQFRKPAFETETT